MGSNVSKDDVELSPDAAQNAVFINELLTQLWPSLNESIHAVVKREVIPLMRRKLKSGKIEVDMGTEPFCFEGIEVFPKGEDENNVTLEIDFKYDGNATVNGSFSPKLPFGVNSIKVEGKLRAILGPLGGGTLPFDAVSLFFMEMPKIDFDYTGVVAIGKCISKAVIMAFAMHCMKTSIVFPNRTVLMLNPDAGVSKDDLENPLPRGILSVTVLSVNNVDEKSDMFVNVSIREQDRSTKVKKIVDVVSANFDETFEFPLLEYEGLKVEFEARAEGWLWGYDTIGSADLSLSKVIDDVRKGQKLTVPLEGTKNGTIDVKFKWIPVKAEKTSGTESFTESLSTILLIRLGSLKGVEIEDGTKYYTEVQVGEYKQETLHAVSRMVDGQPQLRFRDRLRFAQRVSSEEKHISIDVFCSREDSDEYEELYGKVTVPLKDIVDMGAKQDGGDITLSKDYDISDHSGATLQVLVRLMDV